MDQKKQNKKDGKKRKCRGGKGRISKKAKAVRCTHCNVSPCIWISYRSDLIEQGDALSAETRYVITESNARIRAILFNSFRAQARPTDGKWPPQCVLDQIRSLWPSEIYSDGSIHMIPPSSTSDYFEDVRFDTP